MRFSLEKIAYLTGGKMIGIDSIVDRIVTDSRSMGSFESALFVAIEGKNHDGHKYIQTMYERGVRGFIVEKEISFQDFEGAGFVVVDNAITALQDMARSHRQEFKGTVVAITGSNGKTSVKEWIVQLCPKNTKIFRSPKSYNSQLGVALSILMIGGNEDIAIIEAGISMRGEMESLERVIAPHVVILTNIGDAHQANFESYQQKLEEKLQLAKNADTLIFNNEQDLLRENIAQLFADKTLKGVDTQSYNLKLGYKDQISNMNACQAVALYDVLGFELEGIIESSSDLQAVAMRMELKNGILGSTVINDSYNSDINSLAPALDYLSSVAAGRKKVVILSDIMQSGTPSALLYENVAKLLKNKEIDLLIGIGSDIYNNKELFSCSTEFYATTEDFIGSFERQSIRDCAVLIKGSRHFEFEKISHLIEQQVHTTILEVNLDAMIANLNYFRSRLNAGVKMVAMVKALSYGHGTFEIAKMLEEQGVSMLAVAFADEGVTLRSEGITMPIVVLNADSDSFSTMIEHNLEPEIYSFASLEDFDFQLRRHSVSGYPIHIKLDTGMHRLGFVDNQIEQLCSVLKDNDNVKVESIFSHLAVSDECDGQEFTELQIARFESMSSRIIAAMPYKNIIRHISNSAAIEKFPQAQYDAVRLGIGLYGVSAMDQSKLENVSCLKSRIVQIKTHHKGETIGYGRHGKIDATQTIATIPIGYADGLDRRLSRGRWSVMVAGSLAPIIGNICMDTCMIDITGIDAKEGDMVTIFGSEPTIIEMAKVLETIPYEIMTSISMRVKRIYTKE